MSDHHTVIMRVYNKHEFHRTWPRDSERIIQEQRTPALHVQDTPLHLVLATDHAKGSAFEQLLHLVLLRRRQARLGRQNARNIATCRKIQVGPRDVPGFMAHFLKSVFGGFLDDTASLFLHVHSIYLELYVN